MLHARLSAGRLGDWHAGTGPARCAGAVRRRARPNARTRRDKVAGCAGDGPAAGRARGPPLGEWCAQHQPALRLRYVHALLLPRGYAPLVYHTSNCLCARTEGSAEAGRIVLGDPMSEIVKLLPEPGELSA
jgi:hypothetical protein